jgi:hypothetical protein
MVKMALTIYAVVATVVAVVAIIKAVKWNKRVEDGESK